MNPDVQKIEMLITMAERLTIAIEADIAVLKAGCPIEMPSLDPEIQKLSLTYSREASSLDLARTKMAPPELRKRLTSATGKFRDALKLHNRLLTRVRHATEGLIKAVADEVDRARSRQTTYAPQSARPRPSGGAIVYNSVI